LSRDRDFLAVVGQLDPEEHPQVTQFVREAQERIDRKRVRDAARRERGKKIVKAWFRKNPCVDCGCSDVRLLAVPFASRFVR
jgi:hypothetical protein